MQKSVVEILENILDETKREHKNLKGGRKKYLNDLQDSDDFHNESHCEGEIYILEKLLEIFRDQKVEKLNIPMSEDERKSRQKASEDHFKSWWDSEGKEKFDSYDSGLKEHIKKICEESWSNGACIALDEID